MQTMTDGQLLEAYSSRQDDNAFAELMRRHAAMVYRTCHRLLKDAHEAEDASQAVFVVLARKAGGLRKGDLSAWLYRVAHHVAAEVVRKRMRRATREESYAADEVILAESSAADDAPDPALLGLVDAALLSLPDRYREAVILRYLRNRSETEAAQLAGCAVGTLSVRASRGIQRLRQHFARRGVAVSGAALAGLLASEASAATPETLLPSILASVKGLAATTATATGAVSGAMALTQGVMKAMFIAQVKTVSLTAAACLVVAGTGLVVAQQATKPNQEAPARSSSALNRDQLIAAADREAIKAWPQHKPDVRAPGFFIAHKPDGCVRDIKVERQAGLWNVSVAVGLFIAGKQNQIGNVFVPLSDTGMLAGTVVFEGFDPPRPPTASPGSAEAALTWGKAVNGLQLGISLKGNVLLAENFEILQPVRKVVMRVKPRGFSVAFRNTTDRPLVLDRKATQYLTVTGPDADSVREVRSPRRGTYPEAQRHVTLLPGEEWGNGSVFPGPVGTTETEVIKYELLEPGTYRITQIYAVKEAGNTNAWTGTVTSGELVVRLLGPEEGLSTAAWDEATARQRATDWVKSRGSDWGEIVRASKWQDKSWTVTFSKQATVDMHGPVQPSVRVDMRTGECEILTRN